MKTTLLSILLALPVMGNAATYTVSNTNDSGTGSFRQAIVDASSVLGQNRVFFNIPTTDPNFNASMGVWTIFPLSDLPMIAGCYTNMDASSATNSSSP